MAIAKLTKKGQVTIPAEYRKKLGSEVVEIIMEGNEIVIRPVRHLGGVLHKYAFKDKHIEKIMKREKEVIRDAFTKAEDGR